jgi:hypothetical protein
MGGCNDKLDRYNDRTMFEVLTLNERVDTPAISACLSVTCLDINTGHRRISNQSRAEKYASIWKYINILSYKIHSMETSDTCITVFGG